MVKMQEIEKLKAGEQTRGNCSTLHSHVVPAIHKLIEFNLHLKTIDNYTAELKYSWTQPFSHISTRICDKR